MTCRSQCALLLISHPGVVSPLFFFQTNHHHKTAPWFLYNPVLSSSARVCHDFVLLLSLAAAWILFIFSSLQLFFFVTTTTIYLIIIFIIIFSTTFKTFYYYLLLHIIHTHTPFSKTLLELCCLLLFCWLIIFKIIPNLF